MERFVLSGKARTVFKIIELMAKGEELEKLKDLEDKKKELILDNSYQLWPMSN